MKVLIGIPSYKNRQRCLFDLFPDLPSQWDCILFLSEGDEHLEEYKEYCVQPNITLHVTPYEDSYIVLGGNMRLKALKDLKYKEALCKIITDASIEQMKAYIIKDNNDFGDWHFDFSTDDWNLDQLLDWGIDDVLIVNRPEQASTTKEEIEEKKESTEMDLFYSSVYKNYIYAFKDTYIVTPNKIINEECKLIQNAQEESSKSSDNSASIFTLLGDPK